jgi:alpha-2-macroglobulin
MRKQTLALATLLLSAVLLAACELTPTTTSPSEPFPTPSQTPPATSTPLPPRPVIPFTPMPAEILSPIVIQRSPDRGEALLPDGAIELIFDKPMDQAAVASALRVERAGAGEPVAGNLAWTDARTARFQPATALPRDTAFDVILTQDARSRTGEPLGTPFTFRFSTAGYLEVAQVIPAPGSSDIETDATITVIFNRPVVPLTTITEMDSLPAPLSFEPAISGSGEWLNTSIYVFTPDQPLGGGITYRATVSADLRDISGAALPESYVWTFSTIPPGITWVTPREDATLVDINTAIRVQYNQPIDEATAVGAFGLRSSRLLGGAVRGSYSVEGASLVFTPTQPLSFDTLYTVNIEAGVTSAAGGRGMPQPFTWQFTTVPLPSIVETYPADGDRNASPHTEFRIVFNTPIDPTTVMPNLTMSPPISPTQVHTYFAQYNNTFVVYFGAQPSTDYVVTIGSGIADPYGNTIPRGRTVRFRTAPLPPSYQLRVPDFVGTYDAALPARLVLAHLNLNRVGLRLYDLPFSALTETPWQWRSGDRRPDQQALIREWDIRLESPLNRQQHTVIPLVDTATGTLAPGVYLLEVEAPEMGRDPYWRTQRHVLVVSELNLTLKTGPVDSLVWATDLASGMPVQDLALTVIEIDGRLRTTVTTDTDGVARIDLPRDHRTILVTSETPFGVVSADWGRGIEPWDFGVSEGAYGQAQRAYLYTDREIYRPGQTVYFKGVLRAEDDALYSLPTLGQIKVVIGNVMGEELYSERLEVSQLGTFEGSLQLSDSASLGEYVINATFGDDYSISFFTVAAYRPPEFEVTVEAERGEIQRGEPFRARIALSYFFGGPLKSTPVTWNLLAEGTTFQPPWGGTYSFSDTDDPYPCFDCWWRGPAQREALLSGQGVTDENGALAITIDGRTLAEALAKGTQRITLEATAAGPDNQEIAGRTSAVVHPGPFYIGLRARAYVGQAERESAIDLVATDWLGNRQPDIPIRVIFYRREWVNTFAENASGGGVWRWQTEDAIVHETTATTDRLGEAVATFVPEQGGAYHIVAMPASPTATTEAIRSSIFIWVAGPDYVSWRRENHDRITLISDKASYSVGETAEILIPSPFESPHMALVTVEREGIHRHEVIRLDTNSAIYRLPIVDGDIPNIYVSVVLIQPRGDEVATLKMGVIPLTVDLAPRTLDITLEADQDRVEPGEDVAYVLTARMPDGSPATGAEVSIDLVDKAVLSLKPRTQDILGQLFSRRSLQVSTASVLSVSVNRYQHELSEDLNLAEEDLAANGRGAAMDAAEALMSMEAPAAMPTAMSEAEKAMDAVLPEGVEIRETFADTAYWSPRLITDADGKVSVTITLPDNLTTWVVRAVGLTADTVVGEAGAETLATKPLLIRPVTPRFFVVDDRAQVAANVTNNTETPLEVQVTLSAGGLQLAAETPAQQSVSIAANSEAKVTWWVTVSDAPTAELIFSAVSGLYADASRPRLTTGPDGTLLVLRYTAPDTVGTAGQLVEGGARTEAIALPPRFDDRRGQLTIQLDPSLAAGMREGLNYLEHYEYECTEQTVSRFLPNVLTYDATRSLGIEDPELAARLPGLVQEGLTKLRTQQHPDGGWGWWYRADNPQSNPYVSGYVVFALLRARQAGFSVEPSMLDRGLAYLSSQIVALRELGSYREANRQAWLLYVLAEGRVSNRSALDELYGQRDRLGTYARAYLAQALWLQDPDDARLSTLLSDINNAAILSATGAHWEEARHDWWAMNTDTRSTAIVLDTLAKLDPGNALIPNVVRWLMVARRAGIWETTQETAWALISLTRWMVETQELDAAYEFALYLNDIEQLSATATRETAQESIRTTLPLSALTTGTTNALTIARTEGTGRLYYTAHLQVYLPVEEIRAADRGFVVHRRYTLASCEAENRRECPEVREARLGDVIRVDLTLITPHDRYYVVVEDPLPAGGEAIDTGLATTSLLAMTPRLERENSRYWWWWNWYSRSELRDEKVVLFADYLAAGTYEYSYTFRTTLPGDYHVIPTTANEFYFPEVFGRGDGQKLTISQ